MKLNKIAASVRNYLSLGVGIPIPALGSQFQIDGNIIEPGSFLGVFNQIVAAAVAADQVPFTTSAAASITLTALQNLELRLTNGGAVVVTLDSAYNIVNSLNGPFVGQAFPFQIAATGATTVAAPTLTGSGVTLSGTTTVLAAAQRWYQGLVTQIATTSGAALTAGTTFTSLTQIGTTNRYTVVLGTNAIVPTVGQVIFINFTAGSLAGVSGWFPIDLVSSATSFVITIPGAAATATAATLPGTTVVPVSQYTPGMVGVFSPLLTVTGMYATATAVITV